MKFTIIAAITNNYGIGTAGNKLPWIKFASDMKWFKQNTIGNTVIMGRKTFESMNNKPLPNRKNIVISSSLIGTLDESDQIIVCKSLNEALTMSSGGCGEFFVIGGEQLYQLAINHPACQRILLTRTNLNVVCDKFFPKINANMTETEKDAFNENACNCNSGTLTSRCSCGCGCSNDAQKTLNYYLSKIISDGKEMVKVSSGGSSDNENNNNNNENMVEVKYEICEYLRTDVNVAGVAGGVQKSFTPSIIYKGEQGYLKALQDIMMHGMERADRTNVGTYSLFGLTFRYDLSQGFPLLTTKKMFTKAIIEELLWFLRGQTDAKILQAKGIKIWDGNTSRDYLDSRELYSLEEGDIGPGYGFQFRHSGAVYFGCDADYTGKGFDQVQYVLDMIKNNPTSRKIVINLWNPTDLRRMALEPCHMVYQFWMSNDRRLSCSLYQRSGDMGLGVPFNIASASLMTHIFARLTGLGVGELVHTIGDAHIYTNHLAVLKEQINRVPEPFPVLSVMDRNQQKVEDFIYDDFVIKGYYPQKAVQMNMAV